MGLSTRFGMDLAERGRLRLSVVAGTGALALTTVALLLVGAATPLWITAALLAGRGLALGLVIQPLLVGMLSGLAPSRLADANTLFSVAQRLGGSLGVGLLATYFQARLAAGSPVAAFHDTIWVVAGVAVLGLASAPLVRRTA
jgi:hypothetical protein